MWALTLSLFVILSLIVKLINSCFNYSWLTTTKTTVTFIVLILIRVTVPRMKFEVLSKIGWLSIFNMLFWSTTMFLVGFILA